MKYKHLTNEDRMELSILWKKGYPQKDIAEVLQVSPSSISRELKRNSVRSGEYECHKAQYKAYRRRKYSKFVGMKLYHENDLRNYVIEKLQCYWTPEQISERMKLEFPDNTVSFKSIYSWIYSTQGQKYHDLLPSQRYKPKRRKVKKTRFELIKDRVFIEERPEIINQRLRIGDFEGDTMGKPKHTPQTLVAILDRKSRYLFAKKVSQLKDSVSQGFAQLLPLDAKSLTLDNGVENTAYKSLNISTYFCHPYSSWEKGSIENTFMRLRRFIPKKSDLAQFSQSDIDFFVHIMNNTPRKCLGFMTPAEAFKDLSSP